MAFVLQTVAGILRSTPARDSELGCPCNSHPNRCCHKSNHYYSFASFESMYDDLQD